MQPTPEACCGVRHVAEICRISAAADLTFRLERAMLRSNREPHSYDTLDQRCGRRLHCQFALHSLTSSTSPSPSRRVRRAFCVRAVKVRHKLGRTPVGSIAQRLSHQPSYPPRLLRPHSPNHSRSPTSSPCRPTRSTGCWATSAGVPGSTAAQKAGDKDVPEQSGLEEIFEEISPIEDFTGTMSLSFRDHRFEPPKYSVEECKDKDMTYSAPMFVTAEFINNSTGEIKSQTVFMGDFPLMSPKGTFIINGTERVVVSQLVRSPGVYFDRQVDKTSDKDIYSCKVIPSRGAWLEFEIDKRDSVGVRIDRKRKQSVTVLLKALGWDEARILERFGGYESMRATLEKDHTTGQDDALLDIYRKLRPGEPPTRESAQALLENLYFNPKRYDLAKVGRYKINKKLGLSPADPAGHADRGRHRRHHRVPGPAARGRGGDEGRRRHDPGRDRRHRPLRQPAAAHRRRADPEPGPAGPGPDGAGGPGADDHPGRRGDHAADPDQHPAGGRLDQGVLRHQPALAVHGPDQPAGRPDPQAAAVGARPRRPVPRAGRVRGPRRAPVALRPDVPDRDAGRPEHRPDRLAVLLRPGQRVRLRRDPVPQGRRAARSPTRSTT